MSKEFNWIKNYMNYVENTEPPELYKKWSAVSTVAAMLQRKTSVLLGDMEVFPNMYVVLVGPSGARKGTAMKPAGKILSTLSNVNIASQSITREALIQQMVNNSGDAISVDGTPLFHNSTTIFSEELTVFLGYGNLEMLSNLTDWFDCGFGPEGEWTYETIGRGAQTIKGVWVNLLGATTPDLIRRSLPVDAIGGGFTSRVIFVYEEKKGKSVPIPFLTQKQKEIGEQLIAYGEDIISLKGVFSLSEQFLTERYIPWYEKESIENRFAKIRNFEGYSQRRPVHLLKLCMIMSASRSREMIIKVQDFDEAYQLLVDTEKKMPKTFAGYGDNDNSRIIEDIMTEIAINKVVTRSQLMNMFIADITLDELDDIIQALDVMERIKVTHNDRGDTVLEWLSTNEKKGTDYESI